MIRSLLVAACVCVVLAALGTVSAADTKYYLEDGNVIARVDGVKQIAYEVPTIPPVAPALPTTPTIAPEAPTAVVEYVRQQVCENGTCRFVMVPVTRSVASSQFVQAAPQQISFSTAPALTSSTGPEVFTSQAVTATTATYTAAGRAGGFHPVRRLFGRLFGEGRPRLFGGGGCNCGN